MACWVGAGQRGIVGLGAEPEYIGSRVESGRLKESECPRRRTGLGSGGQPQMGENLGSRPGIFDGGDDRQGAATVRTVCHSRLAFLVDLDRHRGRRLLQ